MPKVRQGHSVARPKNNVTLTPTMHSWTGDSSPVTRKSARVGGHAVSLQRLETTDSLCVPLSLLSFTPLRAKTAPFGTGPVSATDATVSVKEAVASEELARVLVSLRRDSFFHLYVEQQSESGVLSRIARTFLADATFRSLSPCKSMVVPR